MFHTSAHDDFETMPQSWALLHVIFQVVVNENHLEHTYMPP